MKFLDYPELEHLSNTLTFESSECKVFTKLEAYSCKAVSKEKRLFKALESAYQQTASTSPPDYLEEALESPFGRLDQPAARKTLFLLIALLNGVFPDHDFSQVNPGDFRREISPAMVLHSLSTTLHSLRAGTGGGPRSYSTFTGSFDDTNAAAYGSSYPSSSSAAGSPPSRAGRAIEGATHAGLASLLDDIMDIRDCEVYTFHPDMDSDPHACPEPDEEGPEPSYYYDDGDDDSEMQSVNVVTPRRGSVASDEIDTPMFDEDLDGGFPSEKRGDRHMAGTSTGAYATSDVPQTPRTPGRTALHGGSGRGFTSGSLTSASSMGGATDDDLDIDGIGGLLWSTYAFFYNRRLKRVLFVSVWSRLNSAATGANSWTSPLATTYEPSIPMPPSFKLPAPVAPAAGGVNTNKRASNKATATTRVSRPAPVSTSLPQPTSSALSTPQPSPAKLAMNRGRRNVRGRATSGSPAPSSLSPFPHASPRAAQEHAVAAAAANTQRQTRAAAAAAATQPSQQQQHMSLDAAALSVSAPSPAGSGSANGSQPPMVTSSPAPSGPSAPTKRAADGDAAGAKRLRRQVAA